MANTTIESGKIDSLTADIKTDLNTARPIVAGGTGATSVITAHDALVTKGSNVASASTINLSTATGPFVDITGTTAITAVTLAEGYQRLARAVAALPLTAGASLIVNGSDSISYTCVAGALLLFEGYSAGVVRVWVLSPTISARPNLYWDGNHVVSQQNTDTLGTTTGYFAADNAAMYFTAATAAMSVQRVSTVSLNGSKYQVEWKCTTAKASLGASDYVSAVTGKIEGLECQQLRWGSASAIPATLSFNYTGPAGLRHVHIQNAAGNRHIAIPFTPAAADTEERITVVVPKDTGGTWTYDNTGMVTIDFIEAAGSTLTGGSASTWSASTYYAASTQKNCLDSTSNVVRITDIQFCADPDATGVAPAWEMPDAAAEERRCQRYYEKSYAMGTAPGTSFTAGGGEHVMSDHATAAFARTIQITRKRVAPTLTVYDADGTSGKVSCYTGSWQNGKTITLTNTSEKYVYVQHAVASSVYTNFAYVANARM